jgi:hypothetical protein
MTHAPRLTLFWLLASVVALVVALAPLKASLVGGQYIPVGNDSFYHAQRILALVADPSDLHEYDTRVHYPEGSMLIWPWGYGYMMSLLTRAGLALNVSSDPMAILAHLPVFAFPMCLLLVIAICRQLSVGTWGTFGAMLAAVLFPLNQGLFGVGNIDHHFAELLFAFGALASGLAWLRDPDSIPKAVVTAVVLGIAPCIHNGLFVVQLPLAAAFAWAWLRGQPLPRNTWVFALLLVIVTLLAALPSKAFRQGGFEFYTLSWFHIYFAACVGAFCAYLSRVKFSRLQLFIVLGASAAAVIPVAAQLLLADRFLSVNVEGAANIGEVQSVWGLGVNSNSLWPVIRFYSLFIFAWPLTAALCVWKFWRSPDAKQGFFWASSFFGLLLLALMIRMHVFGSLALFLPWIVFAEELSRSGKHEPRTVGLAGAFALVIGFAPVVKEVFETKVAGNEPYYALTNDIYPKLADECSRAPGVVLSNRDDANYVLYHTKCAVIANNFLLTPFHEQKVREVDGLMETPAGELRQRAPALRYVFVHKQSLFKLDERGKLHFLPAGDPNAPDPRLVRDLMSAGADQFPPGFRLLQELAFEKPQRAPYARLFAIEPASSAAR